MAAGVVKSSGCASVVDGDRGWNPRLNMADVGDVGLREICSDG